MKANELMIGDLVMFPNSIEKVQEISYVCGKGYCASFAASATLFPISIDKIKPIPLTPKILEKNGFKKNGIPNSVASIKEMDWCDDTYVWSRQETPDERLFVNVYMDDPANFFVEVYCQYCHADGIHVKYLHELQHALKLCGIEKTIEL